MKISLCIILSLAMLFGVSLTTFTSNTEASDRQVGEYKLINNKDVIPSVSAEYVESIFSQRAVPQEYSDEKVRLSDEMLEELSMLYLAVEAAENKLKQQQSNEILDAIAEMKKDIAELEEKIVANGAIQLTPGQVETMFASVNMGNADTKTGEYRYTPAPSGYRPPDTLNTRYYLHGYYVIGTNEGLCTFYYVSATAISANSNMYSSYFIPMNEDRVSAYIDAVVDVYVGKVTGGIASVLAWWSNFLPWELLLNPPATHYSTTATYNILAGYTTNVKFVWCYSESMQRYFLGLVLNSTSVREVHDNSYVVNGDTLGDTHTKTYTVNCDNYNRVSDITREYWEGSEFVHLEYIRQIRYYYNGRLVTTICPEYAQGYDAMN